MLTAMTVVGSCKTQVLTSVVFYDGYILLCQHLLASKDENSSRKSNFFNYVRLKTCGILKSKTVVIPWEISGLIVLNMKTISSCKVSSKDVNFELFQKMRKNIFMDRLLTGHDRNVLVFHQLYLHYKYPKFWVDETL